MGRPETARAHREAARHREAAVAGCRRPAHEGAGMPQYADEVAEPLEELGTVPRRRIRGAGE
ncbi:hypothetical protein [Streptomyces sp. WMMB 322]|uniref:hypothetical protein n=1 Tax=Streptomyces sp. WMMB 322 TaxID=1286821 RepID=UPI000823D326|nr:hypothetical protein [Streptomyces sp. WMMB 322]SCK23803.1 hypothetical protein H180DRAFT_01788 [Streptomyces sp. WMMB 322]